MKEAQARLIARGRNEERKPGDPISVATPIDPYNKNGEWHVGDVVLRDLADVMPVRNFEEI